MSNFLLQSGGGFFTLQDGSGVLLLQSTTTGTTASGSIDTVSLTAPTATVSFDNTSSGSVDAISLTAVSGTASFSNSSSGSIDTVSLTAPDASTSTGDTGVGSIDAIDLLAPSGTASSDSTSSGSFDTITLSAPAGTGGGDATASGSIDEIILGEQDGTASFTGSASTSIDAISLTAPDAVGGSGDTGAGSIDLIDLTAIAATTSYSSSASGSIDAITLTAPTGTASISGGVTGVGTIAQITLSPVSTGYGSLLYLYSDTLVESGGQSGDQFGWSTAVNFDGTILAVGIPSFDNSLTDDGIVNIYDRVSNSWVFRNTITSPNTTTNGKFGSSVSLSDNGSILAVGAIVESSLVGAVHIFDWNGSSWVTRGSALSVGSTSNQFGAGVSLSGDGLILAVGAPLKTGSVSTSGGVLIFDYVDPSWVQRGATIFASDAETSARFGSGVALSKDGLVLFIGAENRDNGALTTAGGVYVYDISGSTYTQRGSVLEPSSLSNQRFGSYVSSNTDGLILIVGAKSYSNAHTSQGGAYVYTYASSSWVLNNQILESPIPLASEGFGAVGLSANHEVLTIGAPGITVGSVYTFALQPAYDIDDIYLGAPTGIGFAVVVNVDVNADFDSINLGELQATASTDAGVGIGYIDSISIGELTAVASPVFDISPTVISQYANSPIILALVTDMMIYLNAEHQRNEFIRNIWDVRTANSQGLDIWGRIVGISRYLTLTNQDYFGFDPDFDPFNNSPFFAGNNVTNTFILSDEDYRRVILAKASANITNCTIPGIENTLTLLFSASGQTWVDVTGDHELTYVFNFVPTDLELAIINAPKLIPRPAGFTIIYDYLT